MKFLSVIRKKQGLTQSELAQLVGLAMNSIARYERGEVQPSAQKAIAIAHALHINVTDLFYGSDSLQGA